jgi:hypothetical protein
MQEQPEFTDLHLPTVSQVDIIGDSEEGRPLHVFYAGPAFARLRLLIIGGQHGDEPRSRIAVENFKRAIYAAPQADVCLAMVPNLNPDGAAHKQRTNSRAIDLNRDHQMLAAAETQALHRFVHRWRPHIIVDVHTYPPRRKRLLEQNLVHCHDIFLDAATNPSLPAGVLTADTPGFLEPILAELNARGHRSARYVLATRSAKMRHSTSSVCDARNAFALRYGITTLLIEGREFLKRDTIHDRARLTAGIEAAIHIAVQWAAHNEAKLTRPAPLVQPSQRVAIRARRPRAESSRTMAFQDALSGDIRFVDMAGRFAPGWRVSRCVRLPAAYAVPRNYQGLIALLHRHNFRVASPRDYEGTKSQRLQLVHDPARPARRFKVKAVTESVPLGDYVLFPVTADGGNALAVYLEPRSKFAVHRCAEMDLSIRINSPYPVLRVLNSAVPNGPQG